MFLITGHSRSGTMYMTKLMLSLGYVVGHEQYSRDGISAWQLAPPTLNGHKPPWECPHLRPVKHTLIHVVRDPWRAIPSVMHTDFGALSMEYRKLFIPFPPGANTPTRATLSYCRWNQLVADRAPDLVVRVEDAPATLAGHFRRTPKWVPPTDINHRPHPPMSCGDLLRQISPVARTELKHFCNRYGYDWPADAEVTA